MGSFILICSFIMLNLFILIIIDFFEAYNLKEDNPLDQFNTNVEKFKKIWNQYAETGNEKIKTNTLVRFLAELPEPLGYHGVKIDHRKHKSLKQYIAKETMNWNLKNTTAEGDHDNTLTFS